MVSVSMKAVGSISASKVVAILLFLKIFTCCDQRCFRDFLASWTVVLMLTSGNGRYRTCFCHWRDVPYFISWRVSPILVAYCFHKLVSLQNLNLNVWLTCRGGPRLDERVCYYDINASSSFGNLTPVRQYTEHEVNSSCILYRHRRPAITSTSLQYQA
jgi:hypothetical protein